MPCSWTARPGISSTALARSSTERASRWRRRSLVAETVSSGSSLIWSDSARDLLRGEVALWSALHRPFRHGHWRLPPRIEARAHLGRKLGVGRRRHDDGELREPLCLVSGLL